MTLRDILGSVNQTSFIYNAVLKQRLVHLTNRNPDIYKNIINDEIIDAYIEKVKGGRREAIRGTTTEFDGMVDYVVDGLPQPCSCVDDFLNVKNKKFTVIIKDIGRYEDEGLVLHKLLTNLDTIFNTNLSLWCNLYISAGQNALNPHIDQHAIMILQFKGEKEWDFFGEVKRWKTDEPVHKIILKQGDFLYFPKWAPHVAKTIPNIETGHATIELPSEFSRDAIYPQSWLDRQA